MSVVLLLLLSESSFWRSQRALSEMGVVLGARVNVRNLVQAMVDAEAAQRGYLLTGRHDYREPYEQALKDVTAAFGWLDRYYTGDAVSRQRLAAMHKLTDTRLSQMALTMRLHDEGKLQNSNEILLSGIGKEQMEGLRVIGAELLNTETGRVASIQNDIYRTLLISRIGVAVLGVVGLFGLFMYLRQSAALEAQQRERQLLVQSQRDQLGLEVAQRTAELTELAQHLQTAREDERHRLARNLHDELGSLLTSAKLDAARIKSRLGTTAPDSLELLNHLVGTLNGSIALGRRIIEDLRPSALGNLGLVASLEILTREFADHSGLQVHCDLQSVPLRPEAELMVYRLVQEAITNITKYAAAQQVWVSLGQRDGQVQVSVRDDGVGFDTRAKPPSAYGLVGMRFRVEAEGGNLNLRSSPGAGTLVQATLPASPPA